MSAGLEGVWVHQVNGSLVGWYPTLEAFKEYERREHTPGFASLRADALVRRDGNEIKLPGGWLHEKLVWVPRIK